MFVPTCASYVFFTIFSGKEYLKLDLRKFSYSSKFVNSIVLVGLPAAIMQGLVALMLTGLNWILADINTTSVAVLGVYYKLQSLVLMPVFGISQGAMPVIGFNYGAKNKTRIFGALKFAGALALAYMTLGLIVFQIFTEPLLSIFDSSDEMLKIGIVAFRRISLMFPFAAVTIIMSTAFQGMGKAHFSMIVTFVRQIVILLPLAWIFGNIFNLDAIWFTFLIAEIIGFILAMYFFRRIYTHAFQMWDEKS